MPDKPRMNTLADIRTAMAFSAMGCLPSILILAAGDIVSSFDFDFYLFRSAIPGSPPVRIASPTVEGAAVAFGSAIRVFSFVLAFCHLILASKHRFHMPDICPLWYGIGLSGAGNVAVTSYTVFSQTYDNSMLHF